MSNILRAGALALPLLLVGCIQTHNEGAAAVYKFESWVPLLVILGGVALMVGAYVKRKDGWYFPVVLGLLGLGLSGVVGAGMYQDNVLVDADHFELHTGFWFSPTYHNVKFAELASIDIIAQTSTSRRGKRTSYYLMCNPKSGSPQKVPVGTLMEEAAAQILDNAEERGVPVNDRTGGA